MDVARGQHGARGLSPAHSYAPNRSVREAARGQGGTLHVGEIGRRQGASGQEGSSAPCAWAEGKRPQCDGHVSAVRSRGGWAFSFSASTPCSARLLCADVTRGKENRRTSRLGCATGGHCLGGGVMCYREMRPGAGIGNAHRVRRGQAGQAGQPPGQPPPLPQPSDLRHTLGDPVSAAAGGHAHMHAPSPCTCVCVLCIYTQTRRLRPPPPPGFRGFSALRRARTPLCRTAPAAVRRWRAGSARPPRGHVLGRCDYQQARPLPPHGREPRLCGPGRAEA